MHDIFAIDLEEVKSRSLGVFEIERAADREDGIADRLGLETAGWEAP